MQFKLEDIAGCFNSNGKLYCADCMDLSEIEDGKSILTYDDVEEGDELYFCDECGRKIE
jgi:hypothetical protein